MNTEEEGHRRQPLDGNPYDRCEVCSLWFTRGRLEYYLGKDRCTNCRNSVSAPSYEEDAQLF